jgi:hypothetical protein
MTKHTPGPWVRDDESIYAPDGSAWKQVAEIPNWRTNPGEVLTAEDNANALLIADAPAMLELLKTLCLPMVSMRPDVALPMGERLEVMQEARALIAKHMEPGQ